MRARTLILLFFVGMISMLAPHTAFAATKVTQDIASTTTWTASGSPYVISSNLTVDSDATLSIEPGTVVKIGSSVSIVVAGTLSAKGTASAPVIFTSTSDDFDGNDTNGDATTTDAAYLPWGQIIVKSGATADFLHADLRYGGSFSPYIPGQAYNIDIVAPLHGVIQNEGVLSFINSTVEHMSFSGGISSEGTLTFSHSAVHDVYTDTALSLSRTAIIADSSFAAGESIDLFRADVTFSKTTVTDPVTIGSDSHIHDGGGNTAPLILAWNGDVESDTVFPAPPFINIVSNISVYAGAILTIAPGAIVKSYSSIDVYGAFIAGSANNVTTTTLTSAADDTVGGDTNAPDEISYTKNAEQQCTVSVGAPALCPKVLAQIAQDGGTINFDPSATDYGWGGIVAEAGSTVTLYHTSVRYAGDSYGSYLASACGNGSDAAQIMCAGQVSNEGGLVSIVGSIFTDALYNQIAQDMGTTTITDTRFASSKRFAYVRGGSFTMNGSSITDEGVGIENESSRDADVRDNWWGSASGPLQTDSNPHGTGPSVSSHVLFDPWLTSDPFAPAPSDPCAVPGSCVSNVLFLPGIEGSRLYEGTGCGKSAEEKLWDPVSSYWGILSGAGDDKVRDLSLNSAGESVCSDIYTKEGDIIDSVGGSNIYASLESEMNGLKSDGTIKDWEPIAYDWRLSLNDLLSKGAERGGKIYYEEATSTPYIEQTLRALAANSKTGKVTIIAHSNGGLVAKALLAKLGDTEAAKLVDKVIMVAVPQAGAPSDIGSMLVGYNAGIYQYGLPIVSDAAARAFTQNSPMAYHLLPSANYLASIIQEPTHPVVHFTGDAYAVEKSVYGNSIVDLSTLDKFLLAANGERQKPATNNLAEAEILSPSLIDYANGVHNSLDAWVPPAGVEVDQIAGWGVDTVGGVDFYSLQGMDALTSLKPVREYRPITIEDGDGTVPVPSALMMASSTDVKRYWVDLNDYRVATSIKRSHSDIFEVPSLQDFIKNIIEGSVSTLPAYISSVQPASTSRNKKLIFFLHSPLTLQLTDASGDVTGLAADGSVSQNIPGSTYSEFGEVKYVTVPEGATYQLSMHGQASGTFSLDMQEITGDTITASSTIAGVPTTASTTVTMSIPSDISTPSPIIIDENGDGVIDATLTPNLGDTVYFDTTPPELHLTFSTTTQALSVTGTDDRGVVTLLSTTTQQKLGWGKIGRNERGHVTVPELQGAKTTITASDASGNTTTLVYTTQSPDHGNHIAISIESLTYTVKTLAQSSTTTALPFTTLTFDWARSRKNSYETFESFLHTATTTVMAMYQAKLNRTIVITSAQDAIKRDSVSNLINFDKYKEASEYMGGGKKEVPGMRSEQKILHGLVIPYMETKEGSLLIGY